MDYLISFGLWNYVGAIVALVFWLIILWLSLRGEPEEVVSLRQELSDMAESNRKNIDLALDNETAWLAARNENLKLKRENHLLKEKISKKREFRLRNGLWCTEEQYMAELNDVNKEPGEPMELNDGISDEVINEMAKETHDAIASADINDECNKQIEEFLKK